MELLILQVILEALKAFQLVYADLPVEERRRAWQDWYDFWRPVLETLRKLQIK